jgi:hypothetical protein
VLPKEPLGKAAVDHQQDAAECDCDPCVGGAGVEHRDVGVLSAPDAGRAVGDQCWGMTWVAAVMVMVVLRSEKSGVLRRLAWWWTDRRGGVVNPEEPGGHAGGGFSAASGSELV